MKQWYETLFANYASNYDNESFTQGTIGECDFIEQEINYDRDTCILDLGCGTGRHTIELTKRGYKVTGIDLSESMLKKAKEKASQENLNIDFQQQDARKLSFHEVFNLVIMLCEGAFPLMETDEMNFQILENASKALRDKGKLIFTTLNGLFPLFHSVKDFLKSATKEDGVKYDKHNFDLMTFRELNTIKLKDDDGNDMELECNERYYVPSEISWLLKSAGFKKIDIYGAQLGGYSRDDALTTKDYEMLVIAEK
ncbi:class I SAM-dependent methyltransferase [Bacteroidota bacterium]